MRSKTYLLALNGVIAAAYAALTLVAAALNLAYGPVQFRFSEALTVLPFLFPGTWPGVFVGCLVANLLSPYGPLDVVLGSAGTLVAALLTQKAPDTVCGFVQNIGREGERAATLTLAELRENTEVDMFTTVFIGNSETALMGGKMVTPRGYLQWGEA